LSGIAPVAGGQLDLDTRDHFGDAGGDLSKQGLVAGEPEDVADVMAFAPSHGFMARLEGETSNALFETLGSVDISHEII